MSLTERMGMGRANLLFLLTLSLLVLPAAALASAISGLTAEEVVKLALQANPQVKSALDRWRSTEHAILPNYVPVDPTFTFGNIDSPKNPFTNPSEQSFAVVQPLQFPGKGYLQGKMASRAADIARLTYQAIMRDMRARAETQYYQILLDEELLGVVGQNVANLHEVLKVTQIAYTGNQATQADVMNAKLALTNEEQTQRQFTIKLANDKSELNQTLFRRADEPLILQDKLQLQPLEVPLDKLTTMAKATRQEILQTALAQKNAETALTLARLEYAPDFVLGYEFDHFMFPSAAPNVTLLQDHSLMVGVNVPIFFWYRQREDNFRAGYDLEAARLDLAAVVNQTEIQIVTLYRQAQFSYQTAVLYRDTQVPLADQTLKVALVAYENGKVDFLTLISALRQLRDFRVAYLQNANQFLAQEFALEQAIGAPLPR